MLEHYLPEIRRQVERLANRPAGRNPFFALGRDLHVSSSHTEVGKRRLDIDPAWESERQIVAWAARNEGGAGNFMKVWALSHTVRDHDCVLVAGAGIGFSSLVAIGAGAAEVMAFEPDPRHAKRLAALEEHGIQAFPLALGAEDCEGALFVSEMDNDRSTLRAERVPEQRDQFIAAFETRVPVRRLDGLCTDFEFDAMLLDCEGSAAEVLEGARGILRRRLPRAVIAVLGEDEEAAAMELLGGLYPRWARIETGDEGWGRLLGPEIAACGHCLPKTLAFYEDEELFPENGDWSAPAPPRSVGGFPPDEVDTGVVVRVVPIGRYGLLPREGGTR